MHNYQKILGLFEFNRDNVPLARRAVQLARIHGAQLGFGSIIDYQSGYECDHAPFMTPRQMLDAIKLDVTEKTSQIIKQIGAHGTEVLVVQGSRLSALESLIKDWRVDLLLIDTTNRDLLNKNLGCDVLTVQSEQKTSVFQGIANAISLAF